MQRSRQLEPIQTAKNFDLLVIGGGATGCGIALDAASRGLKVALVEKNDFAEGTSGRSTKLLHGGVRYLEAAVRKFDRVQYNLVRDGLNERGRLLQNAPHLSRRIELVTPLYSWLEVPYVFAGLKLYDVLSGRKNIGHSRLVGRASALRRFPMLKSAGLKAGVLYYDGQFLDARMALTVALAAQQHGAAIANHVEATGLLKKQGKIIGAELCDRLSGACWPLYATCVINAAGPFVDRVRQLDDPAAAPILKISSGIHIVLDKSFAPPDTGLMIPETDDGRVLFVLPWEGHALVGTTDEPAGLSEHPDPREQEIEYLLRHVARYFNLQVRREDIKAVWSGLRPLVSDPRAADTSQLARDHVILFSASDLLTIAGGKWTTYRKMAEDTVDHAVQHFSLQPHKSCQTQQMVLPGGAAFDPDGDRALSGKYALSREVARHLNRAYGDQADDVCKLGVGGAEMSLLVPGHPYLEAEVIYAVRHELAVRVIDVLARRLSLGLLDRQAALAAIPRVLELMAEELGWGEARIATERAEAEVRLSTWI
jgi:glycerol-3-phosphate dehydrogenase